MAKRAKKILETAGYRVVLTREGDTFLELTDRSAIANAKRAALFVSIQDRHKRHLRQIKPFSKQIDAHKHIKLSLS